MNLKNNYLLKKLLKWANKKYFNIFNIYKVVLFLKDKEKNQDIILFYTCVPNILLIMIYSSWDIEFDRLKLVIMGLLLPFYPSS